MKRTIGALLLALGLAALPARVADAAPPAGELPPGKACADITADASYTNTYGLTGLPVSPATVFAPFKTETEVPFCFGTQYTLHVYATGGTLLAQESMTGDGTISSFQLDAEPSGAPNVVCAALTSSTHAKVIDQAPNAPDGGCAIGTELVLNGDVGASGMR